nr:WG repeat-containing protein [Clostridium sp. DSM 17811]
MTGNYIIKPQFSDLDCFNEGLAVVQVGGKYGFITNPITK